MRVLAHHSITGYSGSRNRRAYTTRSIPIEHARAQVVRATRRQPVCESSRRVGRLRGHRLAGARTRTHSRHNDHLWRATGRGSAAGPPRPRHQPAFDSAEANPRDTYAKEFFNALFLFTIGSRLRNSQILCSLASRRCLSSRSPQNGLRANRRCHRLRPVKRLVRVAALILAVFACDRHGELSEREPAGISALVARPLVRRRERRLDVVDDVAPTLWRPRTACRQRVAVGAGRARGSTCGRVASSRRSHRLGFEQRRDAVPPAALPHRRSVDANRPVEVAPVRLRHRARILRLLLPARPDPDLPELRNRTRLELARDTPYEHVFRAPQHALGDLVHMTVHDLRQLGAPPQDPSREIPWTEKFASR